MRVPELEFLVENVPMAAHEVFLNRSMDAETRLTDRLTCSARLCPWGHAPSIVEASPYPGRPTLISMSERSE